MPPLQCFGPQPVSPSAHRNLAFVAVRQGKPSPHGLPLANPRATRIQGEGTIFSGGLLPDVRSEFGKRRPNPVDQDEQHPGVVRLEAALSWRCPDSQVVRRLFQPFHAPRSIHGPGGLFVRNLLPRVCRFVRGRAVPRGRLLRRRCCKSGVVIRCATWCGSRG